MAEMSLSLNRAGDPHPRTHRVVNALRHYCRRQTMDQSPTGPYSHVFVCLIAVSSQKVEGVLFPGQVRRDAVTIVKSGN